MNNIFHVFEKLENIVRVFEKLENIFRVFENAENFVRVFEFGIGEIRKVGREKIGKKFPNFPSFPSCLRFRPGPSLCSCTTTSCKETCSNSNLFNLHPFLDKFYRWMRFIFCQGNIEWILDFIGRRHVLTYCRNIKAISNAHKVVIEDICDNCSC